MAYATQAEVENAIGAQALLEIADDDKDGTADAPVVSSALDEASSFADGYIYDWLPLSTVPDALRRAVIAIGVEYIRQPRDKSTDDSRKAYEDARAWLKDVQAGKVQLLPKPSDDIVDPGDPDIDVEDREWTRSTASGVF